MEEGTMTHVSASVTEEAPATQLPVWDGWKLTDSRGDGTTAPIEMCYTRRAINMADTVEEVWVRPGARLPE